MMEANVIVTDVTMQLTPADPAVIRARMEGYHAIAAFVIQMDGVTEVRPNIKTHPEFGRAMREAEEAGVQILPLTCHVEPDELLIT